MLDARAAACIDKKITHLTLCKLIRKQFWILERIEQMQHLYDWKNRLLQTRVNAVYKQVGRGSGRRQACVNEKKYFTDTINDTILLMQLLT